MNLLTEDARGRIRDAGNVGALAAFIGLRFVYNAATLAGCYWRNARWARSCR